VRNIQLVIPAAGLGSRFASVGISTPKPLIEVLNLPMIAWVIGNFSLNDLDKIIIITRPELKLKESLYPFLSKLKCKVDFIYISHVTKGPAISVALAKESLDMNQALIVANSDQYVSANFTHFVDEVRSATYAGQILTMSATGSKWSYIRRNQNGLVSEVKEKVEISNEATVGIYGWSEARNFFKSLDLMISLDDRTNGEFYVAPSYNYLINKGLKISAHNIGDFENHVHGFGTPEDLNMFNNQADLISFIKSVKNNLNLEEAEA
jgi:NDP-sugar pyrophosphorylase family protein